ncbi:MAG: 54S ribosomal protein L23, mitochondrial [Paramarteilia canceri]
MTKYDIKEYLEAIYGIPILKISTQIFRGNLRLQYGDQKKRDIQEPDYKIAWIQLPEGYSFKFPSIEEEIEEKLKNIEQERQDNDRKQSKNWFGVTVSN